MLIDTESPGPGVKDGKNKILGNKSTSSKKKTKKSVLKSNEKVKNNGK